MAKVPVINLRKGHAVNHNNDVCVVVSMEHKCPPRMASYVQMSIRSIATKKIYNLRLTSNEYLEGVNLAREEYEFSYIDGMGYHFLEPDTYDDVTVTEDIVEPVKDYLIEGGTYILMFTDETVVSIELPAAITMTVAEAAEGVKGDSANNVYKPATMETGLVVQVPLFIKPGERISVKTEDGSYLGRVNN
ncbi:elongation factor P [Akkermansia glycaniphila]|nr:elongation factor P [Akkermansia glycaniphila]MBT9449926.1 elongation factor P [Akkermansia glycaniphila]OCA02707.1 translation elongation factor P [Akkermansia glycaniphila]